MCVCLSVSVCVWGQVVLIRRRAAIAVFACVCVLHWLPEWVRAVRCVEFGGGGGVWRLPCVGVGVSVCVCVWVGEHCQAIQLCLLLQQFALLSTERTQLFHNSTKCTQILTRSFT